MDTANIMFFFVYFKCLSSFLLKSGKESTNYNGKKCIFIPNHINQGAHLWQHEKANPLFSNKGQWVIFQGSFLYRHRGSNMFDFFNNSSSLYFSFQLQRNTSSSIYIYLRNRNLRNSFKIKNCNFTNKKKRPTTIVSRPFNDVWIRSTLYFASL